MFIRDDTLSERLDYWLVIHMPTWNWFTACCYWLTLVAPHWAWSGTFRMWITWRAYGHALAIPIGEESHA